MHFAMCLLTGANALRSEWKDLSWTGIPAVQKGITKFTHGQRLILFGQNVIDIQGKSTLTLLVEEVRVHAHLTCLRTNGD